MNSILNFLKKTLYPKNNFGLDNEINRVEWLKKTLSSIPKNKKILDAGAGELANKKYCSHLNYVSQDICQYDGKGDGVGLHTKEWNTSKIDIVSDINKIPVADSSFDVVLCTEVLEHMTEPDLAFIEFHRLLKSDGLLILTAPFCSITHFAPYHFSSGFNSYYYQYHLLKLDYEIISITSNGNFFSYVAQELFRVPTIVNEFTRSKVGVFQKILLLLCIRMLEKLSRSDRESSNVLCYGYHIIAKKR